MTSHWLPDQINNWIFNNRLRLLRVLTIILVMVASALMAPRVVARSTPETLLFLALLAVGPVLVLLRWPNLGLWALIPGGMLVPFSIATGSNTAINISVILSAGLLGLWVLELITGQKQFYFSRPFIPLLLFMSVSVLGFGFGQLHWFPIPPASLMAQIGGLSIFLLLGGVFLLTANQITNLRWLEWITWTFLILASIYILATILPLGRTGWWIQGRFQRAVQDSLFWTWVVILAFSQALVNQKLPVWLRGALFVLALSTIYVTVVIKQSWVSGWFPALTAMGIITWFGQPRIRKFILLGACLVLIFQFDNLYNYIFAEGDNEYSLITRLEAWSIMLNIIKVNPLFGLGPSNYYWYTVIFPISGYQVYFSSHNNYFDLVAQVGLIGLALFFWFAWEIGRLGFRLLSITPDGFPKAYAIGGLGGLGAMLVAGMLGDWVIPFVYNVGMQGYRASAIAWLFLGGILVLERLYVRSADPEHELNKESY